MRSVAADANVFVSFFVERNKAQHGAALQLLADAERRLATVVRAVTSFPGMQLVDDCPWKCVLELWPDRLTGLTDAAIVALAVTRRYDAVATFDRKLANKLENFSSSAYF